MNNYWQDAEARNQKIKIYQQLLRGIVKQHTTHRWRNIQMSIFVDMLDADLSLDSTHKIHLILQATRQLLVHAWSGNYSHGEVKSILHMAIDGLDAGIEEIPQSVVRESADGQPVPPPKDMDDIPF